MTLDVDQGTAWIIGAVAAIPLMRQAVGFFRDLKGPQREPPLAEEVAGKYATRKDLQACREKCDAEISCIRTAIAENDTKAERRSIDTHRRIDSLMASSCETNRKLGIIIGSSVARGKAPASVLDDDQT